VGIACGYSHGVALRSHGDGGVDNTILTWGQHEFGALGRHVEPEHGPFPDDEDDPRFPGMNGQASVPRPIAVQHLPGEPVWTQVVATANATFALTEGGDVYGWGTFKVSYRIPSANVLYKCSLVLRVFLEVVKRRHHWF
jgi:regulator of chromosome condensation